MELVVFQTEDFYLLDCATGKLAELRETITSSFFPITRAIPSFSDENRKMGDLRGKAGDVSTVRE